MAEKYSDAAEHLKAARDELLAFIAYPGRVVASIWPIIPRSDLYKEIRCRTDVVGIFPGRSSLIRLIGAVLANNTTNGPKAAAT